MQWVSDLIKILLDNSIRIWQKIGFFIGISILFILVDNYIGLSNYFISTHRLSEVEKIETLLKNKDLSPITRNRLNEIEFEILNRKSIANYTFERLSSFWDSFINLFSNTTIQNINANNIYFYLDFIASGIWFIVGFFIVFVSFLQESEKSITEYSLLVFVFGLCFLFFIYSPRLIEKILPNIADSYFNLFAKFIIHSMFCGLFLASATAKKKP